MEDAESIVDLQWALSGQSVPADHGHALYSALCRALPLLHGAEWLGVHPLRGRPLAPGAIQLPRHPFLTLRLPVERIPVVLALAGKSLNVAGHQLRLGVPHVRGLAPSPSLDARLVVIRLTNVPKTAAGSVDKERMGEAFMAELRRQLEQLGAGHVQAAIRGRQEVRVNGRRILGFSVRLTGLSRADSVLLQARGLGGKRRMGCGIFVPTRSRER